MKTVGGETWKGTYEVGTKDSNGWANSNTVTKEIGMSMKVGFVFKIFDIGMNMDSKYTEEIKNETNGTHEHEMKETTEKTCEEKEEYGSGLAVWQWVTKTTKAPGEVYEAWVD